MKENRTYSFLGTLRFFSIWHMAWQRVNISSFLGWDWPEPQAIKLLAMVFLMNIFLGTLYGLQPPGFLGSLTIRCFVLFSIIDFPKAISPNAMKRHVLSTRRWPFDTQHHINLPSFLLPNDSNFTLMVPQAYVSWQPLRWCGWRLVSLTDKQGAAICFLQCATTIHEVWERQTKAIYHKGQWESFQGLNKDLCELASMRSVIQCAIFHAYF